MNSWLMNEITSFHASFNLLASTRSMVEAPKELRIVGLRSQHDSSQFT